MTTPYDVLARITSNGRAPQPAGERCEMCSEAIADEHQHVVNVAGRQLLCVCRGCYLLFTDSHAQLRYRSVPDRYLSFPDFALDRRTWEALQIPVGLAFFFRNSALDRTVAFYPGPAGATESDLDLEAWTAINSADPRVGLLTDDVPAHADAEQCLLAVLQARGDLDASGSTRLGRSQQVDAHVVGSLADEDGPHWVPDTGHQRDQFRAGVLVQP